MTEHVTNLATLTVHATAVAFGDVAVLLRGASGAGKSDLALRLLALADAGYAGLRVGRLGPIRLIADDYVYLARHGDTVMVTAPEAIHGKLEVRGLGVIDVPTAPAATLRLICDLVTPVAVVRMPEAATADLLGISVPVLHVAAFEASAALKVVLGLSNQG